MLLPSLPFLELSHPQSSRSPRLQFLVKVYITPAALMAWTNDVSLVAREVVKINKEFYFSGFVFSVYRYTDHIYEHI